MTIQQHKDCQISNKFELLGQQLSYQKHINSDSMFLEQLVIFKTMTLI